MLNEKSIFSLPLVKTEFAKYVLLKQYTDIIPKRYYPPDVATTISPGEQRDDAEAIKDFMQQNFNTLELPLYVVIEPTETGFKEIGRYNKGLIRDKDEFVRFLRDSAR